MDLFWIILLSLCVTSATITMFTKHSIRKYVILLFIDMTIVSMILLGGPAYFSTMFAYVVFLVIWSIAVLLESMFLLFCVNSPRN